ncbi:hypothetical protein R6Z07F_012775 [Ovis aries]
MASRDYSLAAVHGFALRRLLLWWRTGSRAHGLQELRFSGPKAQAEQLWRRGVANLGQHVRFLEREEKGAERTENKLY